MSLAEPAIANSVVAVYPDRFAAERAVRQLHEAGFDLGELSIVGRDFQETEEPHGLVSRGDYVKAGVETGSLFGGLFGLCLERDSWSCQDWASSWSPVRSGRR